MHAMISGPSVRKSRESANLSQNTVAKAIGINRMYYSLFEAGRYLLNADEQQALREFLDSRGVRLANDEDDARPPPADEGEGKASQDGDGADPRIGAAANSLDAITEAAQATGLDSKRTAAAVSAAVAALRALDFAELLTVAGVLDATTEGLPTAVEFTALPIEQKQLWESRAAGMLVCDALYQDSWPTVSCEELESAGESVQHAGGDRDWNVRKQGWGLFPADEPFDPLLRCKVAPHIAKAAEQRRAPSLSQSAAD